MALFNNEELFQKIEHDLQNAKDCLNEQMIQEPFYKDFSYRFCWSSNAIEGNTLSLAETISLIDYDEVRSGHTFTEYQEAKNLYHAITDILLPSRKQDITEEWIKKANALVMDWEGNYRKGPVYVGSMAEVIYYPPKAELVPELMQTHISEINIHKESIKEIIETVAKQHIQFERIHPFQDGNGRVGRMILNQQLINHDLFPLCINPKGKYRQAFRRYNKNGDISQMVHILAKEEISAIERIKDYQEKYLESQKEWTPMERALKRRETLNRQRDNEKGREHEVEI